MKTLLIQPPIEDFYDTSIRTYPLSLLYLGTKIKNICDVAVADMRSRKKQRLWEHPFPELQPFYRGDVVTPFSLFGSYSRFGMNESEIQNIVRAHKPDIVGISSLFTTYAGEALATARAIKKVNPDATVVLGGTHPTLFPEYSLGSPDVDYVIRGEGETPLFNLITYIKNRKGKSSHMPPGISYKEAGTLHISEIVTEENIDLVADRTLLDASEYRIGKHPYTFFLTSRGCPFQCAFCGKPPVPYRKRSLSAITKELEQCLALGIKAIDFEDDMLNLDLRFFTNILDRCKGKGLTLSAMNGLYAGNMHREILDRMYEAGFRRLNFSLVDTSKSVHDSQGRAFPEHLAELITYLELTPFLLETHFIIGLPDQKPDDCIDTLIYLMGKRLLPGPSIYYLAPGSPLFKNGYGDDWRSYIKIMRSSALHSANPLFPSKTLYTFMKLTRFINYLKNLIDRSGGSGALSNIKHLPQVASHPHYSFILEQLLQKKVFVWFDSARDGYVEETQDKDLVAYFFERIRGKYIRGFKTMNRITVDI